MIRELLNQLKMRLDLDSTLGMNRRNLEYIQGDNPRERYVLADDKVRAKALLESAGLPVPETLGVVQRRDRIDEFIDILEGSGGFVVKPSRGFGGTGVLVVAGFEGEFVDTSGQVIERASLRMHMASILAGMFSLDHIDDSVLVERLARDHQDLRQLHGTAGVSDLRVIVRNGEPAMAMLRIPCRRSGGTANLHQHGLGLGVDLEAGVTTHAVQDDRPVDRHPDTGLPLSGIAIPHWQEAIQYASRVNDVFGMGYLGADIIFDETKGPLVLEVNVRPGLAIQLANRSGLRAVLEEQSDDGR